MSCGIYGSLVLGGTRPCLEIAAGGGTPGLRLWVTPLCWDLGLSPTL